MNGTDPLEPCAVDVERRGDGDRRTGERRAATGDRAIAFAGRDRRVADRRQRRRRVTDAPALSCPVCGKGLRYDAQLSWNVPGAYAVDAGHCAPCARLFLRTCASGEYVDVTW